MHKTTLVNEEVIKDGTRLLAQFDQEKFPITAALWYDAPDYMRWKFVIVSEVAEKSGPLEAYMRIQRAMAKVHPPTISVDDILVMSPHSRQFRDLRRSIEGITQEELSGQSIPLEGVTFEDAYIYRWPTGKTTTKG